MLHASVVIVELCLQRAATVVLLKYYSKRSLQSLNLFKYTVSAVHVGGSLCTIEIA